MHHTPLQVRPREKSIIGNDHEKDEDLALFQDMEKREREAAKEPVSSSLNRGTSTIAPPETDAEDIFSSTEWDKHDYDWLLTPPPTSFLSSSEQVRVSNWSSLTGSAVVKSTPKVKSGSSRSDPLARADEPPAPVARRSSVVQEPVHAGAGSTSSSKASQKFPTAGIRSSTPSRSATPISSRHIARSSTSSKSAASGASIRLSTQTGRFAAPSNGSVSSSRPSTPSRRPTHTTIVHNSYTAPGRPSPVNKTSSLSKSVASIHPSSAATKARQPSARPIALTETRQELPPNLWTPAAGRPLSNPRGSMALKANTTASAKKGQPQAADVGAKNKGVSSSPLEARVRVSSDSFKRDKAMSMSMSRNGIPHDAAIIARSSDASCMKAADKIVSHRKPLLSQEKMSVASSDAQAKKPIKSAPRGGEIRSSARESSGFGRNLSRMSLDMAIRHMDIRGSALSGSQPSVSNVPASSLYSVRSRNGKGDSYGHGQSTIPITSSPMASSSAASSEHCMSIIMDRDSSELGDDTSSEMGRRASPGHQPDRAMALYNERKVNHWLGSPGGAMDEHDDAADDDIMQNFEHELASLSGPESPLVSQPEGIIECDDNFMLDTMY